MATEPARDSIPRQPAPAAPAATSARASYWLTPAERAALAPAALPDPAPATAMRWIGKFAESRHPADVYADIVAGRQDLVIVDARWHEGWATEHIPGAINLFCRSINSETTAGLRRDAEYVVYCWNESCHASGMAAEKLDALGFTAHELHGGLQQWKAEGFPTERTEPA